MQLARRYPEISRRGGEVVFIACEEKGPEGLRKTLRVHNPPFPVVMDGIMGDLGIGKRYRQRSAFIVDRVGKVVWSYQGSTHVRPKGDTIFRAFLRHTLHRGENPSWEMLRERLVNGSEEEQVAAAVLLGAREKVPAEAAPGLARLLKADSPTARSWGIFALAALGGQSAARALMEALDDRDAAIRLEAVDALRELGTPFNDWQGRYAYPDNLEGIRGELEAALKRLGELDSDRNVRSAARAALRDLKRPNP